jgi:hypothetical protein
MIFYYYLNLLVTLAFTSSSLTDAQLIFSTEELWQSKPERIRSIIEVIDFSHPDLAKIEQTLQQGDTVLAANQLLDYYQQLNRAWVVSTLDPLPLKEAQIITAQLEQDSVTFSGVGGQVPRDSLGYWQWNYIGPEKDDEFGYSLNGHRYLAALHVDDDPRNAELFNRVIQDWVLHHSLPPKEDSIYLVLNNNNGLDYRDIGEVEWRTLEAGRRLGAVWPQLFYGFQNSEHFSPATRILMLSSLAEQAEYLRQYHKKGHNWTTMEMNGLALTGLAFPEFKRANEWADYALEVMSQEIQRQVYPDGVQTELSTKTQWVALNRFESIANNFQKAGREIADSYLVRLEEMYNYLAYSMRPDGHQPLNNDSDREDLRPRVLAAAEKFGRPDWQWIATNGKQGKLPAASPTVTFPWAGIHVMRNGWDEAAHWSFFDCGPFGTGHQHADKLQLSIAAYGKDLLVDGGRYTHQNYFSFDPTIWRGYFRSSFSHNIILVDGQGQNGGPVRVDSPLKENQDYVHHPDYDYAHGTFRDGYEGVEGKAEHSRSVLYLRDQFWVVVDQFNTDRPRTLQTLWHYAPTCEVKVEDNSVVSTNPDEGNLRIVPLGEVPWQTEVISGQEKPVIQGWYSADYGKKEPNPTVVYTAEIDQPTTFAWLLIPAKGTVPTFETTFREEDQTIELTINSQGQITEVQFSKEGDLPKVTIQP